ncbi:PASTA domain-containing protein [Nonomuraea sp. NPDC000554]|uniref:PASTA domain-containing protein n=1 Tax=Nonomuraea sp. NPDC000554 TaxID=3154259 RepID=UPI00331F467E
MTIEDDLANAMAAHVNGVQAPPNLGRTVRRRHRAHVIRFRAAGAALITAAVAVVVPVALNSSEPANTSNAASGKDRAVIRNDVTVPDVTGRRATEAVQALRDAGLKAVLSGMKVHNGQVRAQEPAAGTVVAWGSPITLTVQLPPAPTPQALGDLGDGREFGGIRLTYLPEGLEWGKWSNDDVIGAGKSYTTGYDKPGIPDGEYSVQVIVAHGASADALYNFMPELQVEIVDIGGRPARLSKHGDSAVDGGPSTPTIIWKLRDDLAVEVFINPEYAKEIDGLSELKKIAEGIRAT